MRTSASANNAMKNIACLIPEKNPVIMRMSGVLSQAVVRCRVPSKATGGSELRYYTDTTKNKNAEGEI